MGWWEQDEAGRYFSGDDRQPAPLMWGDEAANVVDEALWKIKAVFVKDLGRLPSTAEVMAGLTFSTAIGLELPDRPENAELASTAQSEAVQKAFHTAHYGDIPIPREVLSARRMIQGIVTNLQKPYLRK